MLICQGGRLFGGGRLLECGCLFEEIQQLSAVFMKLPTEEVST